MDLSNKQPFKAKAYDKVIKQLQEYNNPLCKIEDLDQFSGIGKSIRTKIDEIFKEGFLQAAENEKTTVDCLNCFLEVMCIGPVKAKELYLDHHIRSIEELHKHQDLLNDKQKLGLKYYSDFIQRIPRAEMIKHDELISTILTKIDSDIEFVIAGSYRRGIQTSGDIDILVTHPITIKGVLQNVINKLKNANYIIDDFANGTKKYNGVCKLQANKPARRIDIMVTDPSQFAYAVLYFTGSQQFNIWMRKKFLEKNMTLNEFGLKHMKGPKKDQTIDHVFTSEEAILNFLGYHFIPPYHRLEDEVKYESYKIIPA